jgi:asparagine N-glycosylation enzyme membrane subunit Stt3
LTLEVCTLEKEQLSGVVMLGTILLIILILILIGSLPTWPYSGGWGYYPSGGFGLLVLIVIVLLLVGRI